MVKATHSCQCLGSMVGVITLVLSGWGIAQTGVIYKLTLGLVDRRTADLIHRLMNVPLAFFFLLHVLASARLALTGRPSSKTWLVDSVLIVIGVCLFGVVIYMEYFRLGG